MNIALWIIQIVLAVAFAAAGATKLAQPREKLRQSMAWVEDFSDGTVKLIGAAEVLGAVGLILPAALGVAAWLTPTAAAGLAVVMALAAATHLRRREAPMIGVNLVLLAVAAFIAIERFGPERF
jgi:uncharacterized membrane protein YphA (DoxX/SURF4 family)